MIDLNFNETVSVYRLSDVADTNKKEYAVHIASVSCCIQPLDPEISQDIEGGFGKNWLMFCGPNDIQEGDRIHRGEKEYRITAVESFDFMNNPHMEIAIRIFES